MVEIKDYGMFTDAGDEMIAKVVALAKYHQLTDRSVNQILQALTETEVFAEANDTVVRERVFAALNEKSWWEQ